MNRRTVRVRKEDVQDLPWNFCPRTYPTDRAHKIAKIDNDDDDGFIVYERDDNVETICRLFAALNVASGLRRRHV